MQTAQRSSSGAGTPQHPDLVLEETRVRPVVGWAVVGGLMTAFVVYLMLRWILSDDFRPTPPGPTPVPTYMKAGIVFIALFGFAMTGFLLYRFVLVPWRNERRLTFDGRLIFALMGLFWIDPFALGWGLPYSYNAWVPNRGNWMGGVPLVINPTASRFAEPFFVLILSVYIWQCFACVAIANMAMRWVKRHKPSASNFQILYRSLLALIVFDFLIECVGLRLGYYVFTSSPKWLTLWSDHYYRVPIYEPVCAALLFWSIACIRYFKDDKGVSRVDRGIEQVRLSSKSQTAVRFLALYGACCVIYLATYMIPMIAITQHGDDIPEDIRSRSYFVSQLCGEGTTYACPGQGIPIPTLNSAHLNPDGQLVPGKAKYPGDVPFQRK